MRHRYDPKNPPPVMGYITVDGRQIAIASWHPTFGEQVVALANDIMESLQQNATMPQLPEKRQAERGAQ